MYLKYIQHPDGKRIYTLKSELAGKKTRTAHPPRFSPDDKHASHRLKMKSRYKALFALYKQSGNSYPKYKQLLEEALAKARGGNTLTQ